MIAKWESACEWCDILSEFHLQFRPCVLMGQAYWHACMHLFCTQ